MMMAKNAIPNQNMTDRVAQVRKLLRLFTVHKCMAISYFS